MDTPELYLTVSNGTRGNNWFGTYRDWLLLHRDRLTPQRAEAIREKIARGEIWFGTPIGEVGKDWKFIFLPQGPKGGPKPKTKMELNDDRGTSIALTLFVPLSGILDYVHELESIWRETYGGRVGELTVNGTAFPWPLNPDTRNPTNVRDRIHEAE